MVAVAYEYGGAGGGGRWMDHYLTLTSGNLASSLASLQYNPGKGQHPMPFCKIQLVTFCHKCWPWTLFAILYNY